MSFRLPNTKQRIALLGSTGSGKTLGGLFHLSKSSFETKPWTIIDYKRDEHIEAIPKARYIDSNEKTKHPGIYVLQPEPQEDISNYLTYVWRKGNHGLFFDEGYMISEVPANEQRFVTLLTQGRSLRIPMIVLSQRPVWISRFVFSESDFVQSWRLNDRRDQKTVEAFLPVGAYKRMPDYHSLYYDVGKNKLTYLAPVPDEPKLMQIFEDKLKSLRRAI